MSYILSKSVLNGILGSFIIRVIGFFLTIASTVLFIFYFIRAKMLKWMCLRLPKCSGRSIIYSVAIRFFRELQLIILQLCSEWLSNFPKENAYVTTANEESYNSWTGQQGKPQFSIQTWKKLSNSACNFQPCDSNSLRLLFLLLSNNNNCSLLLLIYLSMK